MRLPDWPERFNQLWKDRRNTPFKWGVHDCCLWASDAVLAITGQDFAAQYRGTYSTAAGAARVLRRDGGVAAIASTALGAPVDPGKATTGDVVLLWQGQPSLAVCNGSTVLAAGPESLVVLPMHLVTQVWKV